jgi:mycothiol S-conjugate amidase
MADLRLMAVHAHPDDESSKGAATMARYAAQGVDVLVVTCTGGERGSILNPALDRPEVRRDLPGLRQRELAAACAILGVRQADLGYVDSGMDDRAEGAPPGSFAALDPTEAVRPLVRLIRSFRPQVVITYDEEGGYPHPDHLMCHRISVLAFDTAGAPADADLGEPWYPSKLYFHGRRTRRRMRALHDAMVAAGLESRFDAWLRRKGDRDDRADRITTSIACGDHFEARDRALRAHASQADPSAFWLDVPPYVQRAAWPTEEFELAVTRVPVELPETDLFAGIRAGAGSSR